MVLSRVRGTIRRGQEPDRSRCRDSAPSVQWSSSAILTSYGSHCWWQTELIWYSWQTVNLTRGRCRRRETTVAAMTQSTIHEWTVHNEHTHRPWVCVCVSDWNRVIAQSVWSSEIVTHGNAHITNIKTLKNSLIFTVQIWKLPVSIKI